MPLQATVCGWHPYPACASNVPCRVRMYRVPYTRSMGALVSTCIRRGEAKAYLHECTVRQVLQQRLAIRSHPGHTLISCLSTWSTRSVRGLGP